MWALHGPSSTGIGHASSGYLDVKQCFDLKKNKIKHFINQDA